MDQELLQATIYGLATGFGAGALRWVWGFFVKKVSEIFSDRLILD